VAVASVAAGLLAVSLREGACGHQQGVAPGPRASVLLATAAELGASSEDVVRAWREVGVLAGRVAERRDAAPVDRLVAVLFGAGGFEREVTSTDLGFVLLPSVLSGHRGTCVGLSALALAVAERAGIALDPVMVPGHFFVRVPGPPSRNVELLRRGEAMPETWYREKYGASGSSGVFGSSGASAAAGSWDVRVYGRALSPTELGAVVWFNAGNERRRAGDLAGARRAFARAAADFPAFAEAEASLGAIHQLAGDLRGAASAYRAAARTRPDLPGLAENLRLLGAEASAASAAAASQRKGDP